ncbi:MAG: hypothetical protein Q4F78_08805 [Bacillota bacterium]|nr:hypothetical protein [Bacillota bacterium]
MAIRYMILAVTHFENTDGCGIEEIMYGIQRVVINRMLDCAVILIIDTLLDSIRECIGTTEDQINRLVCLFISKLLEE